jgi:xanthine dehydrogenase accessory factor
MLQTYLPVLSEWLRNHKKCCMATVTATWGSAPRPVGSVMFIGPEGQMLGSVSGGCVEGALLRMAPEVISEGRGRMLSFGVSDSDAWAVGLTCGGKMEVFLEPFPFEDAPALWPLWQQCLSENRDCVLATCVEEGRAAHLLVAPKGVPGSESDGFPQLAEMASAAWQQRRSGVVQLPDGRWMLNVFARKPQLILVGAAHVAAELVHLAHYLQFETIVIEPRRAFAENTHFPTPPDQLKQDYPAEVLPAYTLDAYTFAVVMAHDPKIDDQALHLLLRSQVAYIGALSSKASNEQRRARLTGAGFTEAEIARIHAPVGLPIGSKTAPEIALSIMAQVVGVKNSGHLSGFSQLKS